LLLWEAWEVICADNQANRPETEVKNFPFTSHLLPTLFPFISHFFARENFNVSRRWKWLQCLAARGFQHSYSAKLQHCAEVAQGNLQTQMCA
jgi:hypothetical protein